MASNPPLWVLFVAAITGTLTTGVADIEATASPRGGRYVVRGRYSVTLTGVSLRCDRSLATSTHSSVRG